jgi:hypothetical protein
LPDRKPALSVSDPAATNQRGHASGASSLLRVNALLIAKQLGLQYAELLDDPLPPHLEALLNKLGESEAMADRQEASGEPPPQGGKLDERTLEHLGQQLRAMLDARAEKPTYLGDRALPSEFEHQLLRLEATEEVHEKGVEAVREALGIPEDAPPGRRE